MAEPNKLFIGNLSYDCSEGHLCSHFEQYGKVDDAVIIKDRDTGRPRGFGFVTFKNEADAQAAIEKTNGSDFLGRDITVREAESRRRGEGGGRRGGGYSGGGYGGGGGGYGGGGGGYERSRDRRGNDDRYGGGGGGYRGGNDEYGNRSGGYRGGRDR